MDFDEKSLLSLEALMNEFFAVGTTNGRKREIEGLLDGFSAQQNAWKHCLAFFTHSTNEYVLMYCLTVMENLINRQWMKMSGPDKGQIRIALYQFLLSHHQKVPNFISNKLGKLIVDIGRIDWPYLYPDFFLNIHQLAQSPENAPLGLMLVQTTFEELTSSREDLSVTRKEELRRLLLEQVPTVLNILCGHLESVLEKHCHVTATPPPSPTHFSDGSRESLFSTSPIHAGSLLGGIFKSTKKNPFHHMPPLDPESHQLCVLSLKCLALLLSWMPLSSYVTSSLLTTVFHFASFGCSPQPPKVSMHCNGNASNTDLGIQAMSCINEIMSRNCIPNDFEEFLVQMFHDTFHLMQHLTKDTGFSENGVSSRLALSHINESFAEKFTDFLSLFVSLHLKRFEGNPHFPVLEFLALLFKYTFQQPKKEGFYSCLDIWNTFLDYLSIQLKNRNSEQDTILLKYKDALLALVQQILQKIQFRFNQSNLEELNDEDLDDDDKTEWQHFLRQCLEVTSKVCNIVSPEVYELVYSIFEENMQIFMNLTQYIQIEESSGKAHLQVCGEIECRRLHCSLRDLSSVLQAIGRLVDQMCGVHYQDRKTLAEKTIEKLCHAAEYSNRIKFYDIKTAAPLVLRTDFVELHAQIMATLKAFCHWLTMYNKEAELITTSIGPRSIEHAIAEVAVPNIGKKVPQKIVHSASHLLLSLTVTVRPKFLFQLPCLQKLYSNVCAGELQFLPVETQFVVYRSLSNMMVLPWMEIRDHQQEWMTRSSQHDTLICALSSPLKNALGNPLFAHEKVLQELAKTDIRWVLRVHCDLIENVADAPTRTKQLFHQSIQQLISMIESLFHVYLNHSDVSENILDFFLCLFTVLKVQIGPVFVEQTMQNFLNFFTTNHLIGCILNEGTSGNKVAQKLLQLLQRIIQEPGSHTQTHLPGTISLCMQQIYPIVAERPSCEVKPILFDLLYSILLHNWRYFFKSHVITSYIQTGNEIMENESAFIKIMEAYGHSFLLPDISLFRQNLTALESLNSKWKLYHKVFFKSIMLDQFLKVFLQSLIQKSHNLLQEEITVSIYSMASVDFSHFFSVFLPQFLETIDTLDVNQKNVLLQNFTQEVDLPSFTQNTQRFVCDLRYYSICNSFIP